MNLTLYVTRGCHLCEDALAVLADAGLGDVVQTVEIGYDEALALRYGARIPVLHVSASGRELDWPFTAAEVRAWVAGSALLRDGIF
ncbi:glutaredoxin family protein [Immundisolibacter sp.]|uniref:glutaredoxin family protein n=1 Tax=Immundisolibacter sp. TaxID=1934948 RepID=UPI002629518A|nr:glutaredoxin family protein [Immundisolibacter sp.]MDD3652380.1 glutaredoxin family protein [Immundisolibacter sp.]